MPVILSSEKEKIWLNPEETRTVKLKKCFKAGEMVRFLKFSKDNEEVRDYYGFI